VSKTTALLNDKSPIIEGSAIKSIPFSSLLFSIGEVLRPNVVIFFNKKNHLEFSR
jgi:hypothetical protein